MKDKKFKSIVEGECRGLQEERNKRKEREILDSILAFLFFSHLFSLSCVTGIEATCGHVQERIAHRGTYNRRARTVYSP